jgi:acetyl esterase
MPVYNAKSIPAEVHSSTKDPEVAAFLKTGPVLGAHKPIHEQRVEHNAFIDKVKPPIGKIEHLVLDGPHGSLPVRVYYPSKPDRQRAALSSTFMAAASSSARWISLTRLCACSPR